MQSVFIRNKVNWLIKKAIIRKSITVFVCVFISIDSQPSEKGTKPPDRHVWSFWVTCVLEAPRRVQWLGATGVSSTGTSLFTHWNITSPPEDASTTFPWKTGKNSRFVFLSQNHVTSTSQENTQHMKIISISVIWLCSVNHWDDDGNQCLEITTFSVRWRRVNRADLVHGSWTVRSETGRTLQHFPRFAKRPLALARHLSTQFAGHFLWDGMMF